MLKDGWMDWAHVRSGRTGWSSGLLACHPSLGVVFFFLFVRPSLQIQDTHIPPREMLDAQVGERTSSAWLLYAALD